MGCQHTPSGQKVGPAASQHTIVHCMVNIGVAFCHNECTLEMMFFGVPFTGVNGTPVSVFILYRWAFHGTIYFVLYAGFNSQNLV